MKVLNTPSSTSNNDMLFEFTQGIDVDSRLYKQEIRVQKAWARALLSAGFLTNEDVAKISACV
jgi:argininosuccinate lyase